MYKYLCVFIFFNSCVTNTNDSTVKTAFYLRIQTGFNSLNFYSDYLVINNYKNGVFNIDSFLAIATYYVDTVKSKYPVTHVSFVAKPFNVSLPPGSWNTIRQLKKFFIISFGFVSDSLGRLNHPLKIDNISIWKNGEAKSYGISILPKYFYRNQQVDSVLNSKSPLDNGYD